MDNSMKLLRLVQHWRFDPLSSVVTIVLIPFLVYLLRIILVHLKRFGSYAVEGVLYAANRYLWHSLAASLSLRRYCRLQLGNESQHLFVPSSKDIKLDLDQVFVTLSMDFQGSSQKDYSHRDMLRISNRLRVVGDPGSGKSSLTKKLFREACYRAMFHPRRAKLPIRVELKTLQPPKGLKPDLSRKWLYTHTLSLAKRTAVYRMEECFESYAQTQGLLILLDGLDEVALDDFSRVHAVIDGLSKTLAEKSANNIIVLTMRTQFHQQIREKYRDNFGPALFIKPFTPTDIYEFLTRWPFQTERSAHVARIYKQLTDRPTLREMCTNPLILSMYVAEDQNSREVIAPESRTQFYSKVTEELILKRRFKQTGPQPAPMKLKEQRERILGRVCYEHLLNPAQPANSLSWADGVQITKVVLGGQEHEAEDALRELSKETGLFTEERTGESFRFIHLTLCEFLAAYETVQGQRDGWKQLLSKHRAFLGDPQPQVRTRLLEAIPFACGLLPRVQRDQALADVSTLNDFRLLARCFFETKLYEHASWRQFVERAQNALLETAEDKWDERWLSDLHLLNLVVRDANLSVMHSLHAPTTDLSGLFTGLVQRQKDSLAKLLGAYASQDAAAALRTAEVCGLDLPVAFPQIVIKHCDQPPFLALITEQSNREPERGQMWARLIAEAGLRSRLVAETLHELTPAATWENLVSRVPRQELWFLHGIVERSYYTELVTIASSSPDENSHLPLLSVLSDIPPPGSRQVSNFFDMWVPRVLMLVMSLFIAGLAVNEFLLGLGNRHLTPTKVATIFNLAGVASLTTIFLLSNRQKNRKAAYRFMLNLSSRADRSGKSFLFRYPEGEKFSRSTLEILVDNDPLEILSRLLRVARAPGELRRYLMLIKTLRDNPSFAEAMSKSPESLKQALKEYLRAGGTH
jgi:hypothetical protein